MRHHNRDGKVEVTERGYLLAGCRFPNRLEKVRRLGVEIAVSEANRLGVGHPSRVRFDGFQILYFTPFNKPTHWRWIDWEDNRVRCFLYGLSISSRRGSCLRVFWEDHDLENFELDVELFRDPTGDNWDKRLGRDWDSFRLRKHSEHA